MGDRISASGKVHFLDPKLPLMVLRRMEEDIERVALKEIERRGLEKVLIQNPKDYDEKFKRVNPDEGRVYFLCDQEGHLIDSRPLLNFIPKEQKDEYLKFKNRYLNMYLNPN